MKETIAMPINVIPKKDINGFKKGTPIMVLIQKPSYGGFRLFPYSVMTNIQGINYQDDESLLNDFDIDDTNISTDGGVIQRLQII